MISSGGRKFATKEEAAAYWLHCLQNDCKLVWTGDHSFKWLPGNIQILETSLNNLKELVKNHG